MIKPSLVCLDIWGVLAFSTMPKSSCLNFRWTRCLHICLRRAETSTSLRFTLTNELLHTLLERLHVLFRRDLVHFTCFHLTGWNEKSKTIGRVPRCQREHYIYNFFPQKIRASVGKPFDHFHWRVLCDHTGTIFIAIHYIPRQWTIKKTLPRMYVPRTTTSQLIC